MIFVNSISELQQNNLCFREKPYFQPIVIESDLTLQGFLPKQVQNDYTIEIHLLSSDGDTFIADVTDNFEILFGVSIYNQNYFNIKLKTFAPSFENIDCFILNVIIKNAGFKVFDKITEPYQKLKSTKVCYAVVDDFAMMIVNKTGYIKINDQVFQFGQGLQEASFDVDYRDGNYFIYVDCLDVVQIGYCYQQEDYIIDVPLTATAFIDSKNCNLPLMRVESSYNCQDNILGGYYGDPKLFLNYPNNAVNLKHSNSNYIYSEIENQPTSIKRESTKNGKPQSVEFIQKYNFVGLQLFPKWKMLETEALFSGRRIFVNGIEYIFRGGSIFKKAELKGSCSYTLEAELEDAPKINDFNCLDDCVTNCTYFVIPSGAKDQNYYDENKQLIGVTFAELLAYFLNMSDIISVTDIPTNEIECDIVAVIKIDSFGLVPSFLYYKLPLNEYRIFAKYDDCETPKKLCEGISFCPKPKGITSSFSEYLSCAQIPTGITSEMIDLSEFEELEVIQFYDRWTADSISIKKYIDHFTIEFVLSNVGYDDTVNLNGSNVMKIPITPISILNANYDNASYFIFDTGIISAFGYTSGDKLRLIKTFPL